MRTTNVSRRELRRSDLNDNDHHNSDENELNVETRLNDFLSRTLENEGGRSNRDQPQSKTNLV